MVDLPSAGADRADRRLVLGISTSSERGGAALVLDGTLLAAQGYEGSMTHAERIVGAIDALLTGAGLEPSAIGAIGCDVGPGSFTGVRAGLAAAKGIALGLGVPMVGVGSLEALAACAAATGADRGPSTIVALLDAKRSETFYAVYDRLGSLLHPPSHAPTAEVWRALEPWTRAPGVAIVGQQTREVGLPAVAQRRGAVVLEQGCELPSAGWVARLAERRWRLGGGVDPQAIEPVYTRPPDAKLPEPRATIPRGG